MVLPYSVVTTDYPMRFWYYLGCMAVIVAIAITALVIAIVILALIVAIATTAIDIVLLPTFASSILTFILTAFLVAISLAAITTLVVSIFISILICKFLLCFGNLRKYVSVHSLGNTLGRNGVMVVLAIVVYICKPFKIIFCERALVLLTSICCISCLLNLGATFQLRLQVYL